MTGRDISCLSSELVLVVRCIHKDGVYKALAGHLAILTCYIILLVNVTASLV